MLRRWFVESKNLVNVSMMVLDGWMDEGTLYCCCFQTYLWHQDEAVVAWLESSLKNDVMAQYVMSIERESIIREVSRFVQHMFMLSTVFLVGNASSFVSYNFILQCFFPCDCVSCNFIIFVACLLVIQRLLLIVWYKQDSSYQQLNEEK